VSDSESYPQYLYPMTRIYHTRKGYRFRESNRFRDPFTTMECQCVRSTEGRLQNGVARAKPSRKTDSWLFDSWKKHAPSGLVETSDLDLLLSGSLRTSGAATH
jgi:hypothetical protein